MCQPDKHYPGQNLVYEAGGFYRPLGLILVNSSDLQSLTKSDSYFRPSSSRMMATFQGLGPFHTQLGRVSGRTRQVLTFLCDHR